LSEVHSPIIEYDPRGVILGYVPLPNGDAAGTNFAFGGPDNQCIYMEGAVSGTIWRFRAPYPGLIGPGGVKPRLISFLQQVA
jgi:gluconolactonase